jgi:dipeptidyl aminopeptidase/acylaminoacyl peptidase
VKLLAIRSFLFVLSVVLLAPVVAKDDPYPLEYWALRSVVNNVSLSPDGERLSLMAIANRDADPVLTIYNAADLSAEPFRVNADPMEITGAYWVSDRQMIVSLRQKVRDRIDGFNRGVYEGRIALLDVDKKSIEQFNEVNPSITSLLPGDPEHIIISFQPEDRGISNLDPRFRPRSYYKLNLERGTKQLLIKGSSAVGQVSFDAEGNPIIARGFDVSAGEFVWQYREPGGSGWTELYRQSEEDFGAFSIQGRHPTNDDKLLVLANNGHDKAKLWSFDIASGEFGGVVFERDDVDVAGTRDHSMAWTQPDTVVGATYRTDKTHTAWFDEVEAATYQQLEGLIPNSHEVYIISRSRDGQALVAFNVGPKDPGTYYLLKDGQFKVVGKRQPLLEAERLANVEYISYQARDGRTISAYLTIPDGGEKPYPLIVLPHGGPFVGETIGYDEWGQMLADNGYLVLQPQYRGSRGHGMDHYMSAFNDGGQGGYKMQDDKDDGALYLVEQGWADKDRLAMFGWSYGGYAALVAAARKPQIYQCVIAGAAVSDNLMQLNYYRDRLRGASRTEQINFWQDSVSPVDQAADVNVPMLLVHGDVDQRVPVDHVEKYRKSLADKGKAFEYVELEGADHFSNTLFYDHQLKLYKAMIEFLEEDCGPDGL